MSPEDCMRREKVRESADKIVNSELYKALASRPKAR